LGVGSWKSGVELVLSRRNELLDDEYFNWSALGVQLQPELFPERGLEGWTVGIDGG
jgi:hypothetical protein